jgi:hypothetical protein
MTPRSRPVRPDEKESQNESVSGSVSDSNSDLELDSEDSDDDDPGDDSFEDEGQLPPEHYLAKAESLDVSRLRQTRYSDSTRERLDETRVYWDR